MKAQHLFFSMSAIGILALSSCQSHKTGSGADVVDAQQYADGMMPPWMVEDGGDNDLTQYRASDTTASEPVQIAGVAVAPPSVLNPETPPVVRPSATKSSASSSKPSTFWYEVRKGDTMLSIAKKYGTTTAAIKSVNGLKGTSVKRGQDLRIPRKAQLVSTKQSSSSSSRGSFTYVVGRGDSMAEIAERYDTTTTAIRRANGLSSSTVKRGQELKIPRGASSSSTKSTANSSSSKSKSKSISYTVKRGDTMASIAKKFGSTPTAIKNASGLKSTSVKRGQTISIPK